MQEAIQLQMLIRSSSALDRGEGGVGQHKLATNREDVMGGVLFLQSNGISNFYLRSFVVFALYCFHWLHGFLKRFFCQRSYSSILIFVLLFFALGFFS